MTYTESSTTNSPDKENETQGGSCPISNCLPRGCNCESLNISDPVFQAILQAKLIVLKQNLKLNKRNLTSFKATKISVPDNRVSSVITGGLGITMLVVALAVIVVPDIFDFLRHIKRKV